MTSESKEEIDYQRRKRRKTSLFTNEWKTEFKLFEGNMILLSVQLYFHKKRELQEEETSTTKLKLKSMLYGGILN